MTWAKLDDRFHQDPRLQRLSRDTRLLYVEGLAYCAQQLTDGFIADYMLRKITDSQDADHAAQELVDGGVWELADQDRDKGWSVVGYLESQSSREDVEKARKLSAETTARSRRHKAGDHSLCTKGRYCPEGAVTRHMTRQSSSQSDGQSCPLDPTLSDPTPREGKERRSEAAPPAPLRSQERTSSKPGRGFTVTMPEPHEAPSLLEGTP
jgi:hypothetical protein